MKKVRLPHNGLEVTLVDRSILRRQTPHARMRTPSEVVNIPIPPTVCDWTKGNALAFPMLGNDRYGDCMYAAACHGSQTMTGNASAEDSFDVQTVVNAYLRLSGGDNGLGMDQIMGEWKRGLVGTSHAILDDLAVPLASLRLAIWLFGGVQFTLAIPDPWLHQSRPGFVWSAGLGVSPDPANGHGVWLNGFNPGALVVQTWGFNPPGQITDSGVQACDAAADAVFSLDWFSAQGVAPNGFTYDQLAGFWVALGGRTPPPSPFVPGPLPLPPVPPPAPPAPPKGMLFDDVMTGLLAMYRKSPRDYAVLQGVKAVGDHYQSGRLTPPPLV